MDFNRYIPANYGPKHLLVLDGSISSSYTRKRLFGLLESQAPVEHVDVTLRFYRGPRGKATFTFAGPFAHNTVVKANEGSAELTFPAGQSEDRSPHPVRFHDAPLGTRREITITWGTLCTFRTSLPFEDTADIFAYDAEGHRQTIDSTSGSWGQDGVEARLCGYDLNPSSIQYITVNEHPHEKTFHHIRVPYPDRQPQPAR